MSKLLCNVLKYSGGGQTPQMLPLVARLPGSFAHGLASNNQTRLFIYALDAIS